MRNDYLTAQAEKRSDLPFQGMHSKKKPDRISVFVSNCTGSQPQGIAALDDWQRYTQRAAQKFPFLQPDRIMDASRKKPGQSGYNPRTLHIPPTWFKDNKISEGQRQWYVSSWDLRCVYFFRVLRGQQEPVCTMSLLSNDDFLHSGGWHVHRHCCGMHGEAAHAHQ